ncbi:hypothetical protein M2349_002623 [Caldanaerobacter subterraneus subsp. tengcongensis MB4]|nr:hypothetical protein [Caldanaerobacter subterraneus subsp. tengcongensis MB4]
MIYIDTDRKEGRKMLKDSDKVSVIIKVDKNKSKKEVVGYG